MARRIASTHAHEFDDEVKQDAVLQTHLGCPFLIHRRKPLLGLNAVVVDAEQLPPGASCPDPGQAARSIAGKHRSGCQRIQLRLHGLADSRNLVRLGLRLLLRLVEQLGPRVLAEPRRQPAGQRSMPRNGNYCGLSGLVSLGVVGLHGRFMGFQFRFDFSALISLRLLQGLRQVGELIAIEIQLRFGDAEVRVIVGVVIRGARLRSLCGRSEQIHSLLILGHELFELIHFLRERQRIPGEGALLRFEVGFAQRSGKCLVDGMVGEALGLARILFFFGRGGHAGQSLRRGPGACIDQGGARRNSSFPCGTADEP